MGEGSFAVTYLAEDLVLGRQVAVKVLHARYGNDPAAAARFEREARAAAAVSSPYLVDVFDYGIDQGASYIVLQYVAGPTLRQLIDRTGRLETGEAVRIAVSILHGLAVIHQAGIIHRDVKPQNVLIDRNGTARVTDFGVALWSGMEHLTSQGLAVGTALYMAPEQAQGGETTPVVDLYAVGVLLFEMLTGRPPFQADHPAALMMAHLRQQPPLPTEVLPGLSLPVAIEREVMRALAKEPEQRRASANEMASALAAAVAGRALATPPTSGSGADDRTTASIPALGGRAELPRSAATSVAPAVRRTPVRPVRAWLGPLALLAVALVIVAAIAMRGGFGGLAGLVPPGDDREQAGLVLTTPTPELAIVPEPAIVPDPTIAPEPTVAPELTATVASAPTIVPTPVPSATALQEQDRVLFPIATTAAQAAEPTEIPVPPTVTAPAPTSTPIPPTPTQPVNSIAVAPTRQPTTEAAQPTNAANAQEEFGATDGTALTFDARDWQGVPAADPALGRPAVALYGADGDAARAALRFELPNAPTGRMVLTLTGLGDETGLPFPFGIEVNGYYIGEPQRSFANWNPAQDGLNGEQAAWDQVRINLPPELFSAGPNEVAIVSLAPGDYDDRVPYLLLSDATLTPASE